MLDQLLPMVSRDAVKVALVLALAFFIGLEREEHKQREAGYAFGGIRTFPLIGLVSYSLALIAGPELWAWIAGLLVVGALMWLSYHHKLAHEPSAGLTPEMSALATYVVGGLVQHELYWIATTIAVLNVLLLELKIGLEGLAGHIASREIITVGKFLVLAAVILPIVPDRDLTAFHINPFKTWLVVVAVSGVSFGSYVLQRLLKQRGGVMLSAVLGGAYSSTVTTVVLARQSKQVSGQPHMFSGSILTASAVMYVRLLLLLAVFNPALALRLLAAFGALATIGALAGFFVYRQHDPAASKGAAAPRTARNPLELRSAFLFAAVFVLVMALTHVARQYLGRTGLFTLAAIMGVTDVDPFILGLTQTSPDHMAITTAATAVVIAAASNSLVKAVYAYGFADRATGRRSSVLLLGFALLGLVPLMWI